MAEQQPQTLAADQQPQAARDLRSEQRAGSTKESRGELSKEEEDARHAKRGEIAQQKKQSNDAKPEAASDQKSQQRALAMEKRMAVMSNIKEKGVVGAAKDAITEAGKKLTAKVLKQCWLNIISSWGLTLLYINFHFLAKYLGGVALFCDFGEEWTADISSKTGIKVGSGALKYAEIIILILVDALLIIAIAAILLALFAPALMIAGLSSWLGGLFGI